MVMVCKHCGLPVEQLNHTLNGAPNREWTHRSGPRYHVKCRNMDSKAEPR